MSSICPSWSTSHPPYPPPSVPWEAALNVTHGTASFHRLTGLAVPSDKDGDSCNTLPPHSPSSESVTTPSPWPFRPGGNYFYYTSHWGAALSTAASLPLPTLWWSLLYTPQITQLDSFISSSWCPKLIFISKHKHDPEWWQKVIINIYCYDLKVHVPPQIHILKS